MGVKYASQEDITVLGKKLTAEQQTAAEALIEAASAKLRIIAKKYGKDIDAMIADDDDYDLIVRNTVVQAVTRALSCISDSAPAITQGSQSAMGYSVSMTYLNAGQSLYFLRNELKDLGILRQTFGSLEVYQDDTGD